MRFKINNDRGWGPKTSITRNSSTDSCATERHENSRGRGRSNGKIMGSADDQPQQQPSGRQKAWEK